MSNGPEFGIDNPIGGISEPKSNKKLWIYGGLGCFGLIGLVCIGCSVLGYVFAKPSLEFMNENKAFVGSSQKVEDELGVPLKVGDMSPTPGAPGQMVYRGKVSGPKGEGTYVIEATLNGITPVREAIYLQVGEDKIDLDPDAELNLDIDDGSN